MNRERPGRQRRPAALALSAGCHPRGGPGRSRTCQRVVASMAAAARAAGVAIVAGDTKVVERGKCDRMFITTAGVGLVPAGARTHAASVDPPRRRGAAQRPHRQPRGRRDGRAQRALVRAAALPATPRRSAALSQPRSSRRRCAICVMRDPTRAGLSATTLKEFALESGRRILVREADVPVLPGVRGACDLLGLDPLYVANEGILIASSRRRPTRPAARGDARAPARARRGRDRRSRRGSGTPRSCCRPPRPAAGSSTCSSASSSASVSPQTGNPLTTPIPDRENT